MSTLDHNGDPLLNEQLDKHMHTLAERFLPPPAMSQRAHKLIDDIVQCVLHCPKAKFRVSRSVVAGSFGKGTAIHPLWDIDIVFFVTFPGSPGEATPPFPDVLSAFDDALTLKFDNVDVKPAGPFCLKVVKDNLHFDVLVAPDLIRNPEQIRASGPAWAQRQVLLDKLDGASFKELRPYNCAFAETAVAFVKDQSPFVMACVRSAKTWSKTLVFSKHPRSLSLFTELVSIHTAQRVEKEAGQSRRRPTVLAALDAFLRACYDSRSLNVFWFQHYNADDVPPDLLQQRPLVLEPSNPFNNICHTFSRQQFEELAKFAATGLRAIERALLTGLAPLFQAQFGLEVFAHIREAIGPQRLKVMSTSVVFGPQDSNGLMLPVCTDKVNGNYSLQQLTGPLCNMVAIATAFALCFGDQSAAKTAVRSLIDTVLMGVSAISRPINWTDFTGWPPRQIELMIPASESVAMGVCFDIQ